MRQRVDFKQSKGGLNSEIFFSETGKKLENPVCSPTYPRLVGTEFEFMPIP